MSTQAHAAPGSAAQGGTKPWKLIMTLAAGGAIAGALIVSVFQLTQPRILENQAAEMERAITRAIAGAEKFQTLFLYQDQLVTEVPAAVDTVPLEKVYVGFDGQGQQLGYAIIGAEPGFADVIRLIFGYDSKSRQVLGMLVVEQKETPGLGDKIVKDTAFVNGFRSRATPLQGVKIGAGKGGANEVDMITGATISSRIIVGIINHQVERLQPMIEAYEKRGGA